MAFGIDPTAYDPAEDAAHDRLYDQIDAREQIEQLASVFLDQVEALTASHPAFREVGFYKVEYNKQGTAIYQKTTKEDALESVAEVVREYLWEVEA